MYQIVLSGSLDIKMNFFHHLLRISLLSPPVSRCHPRVGALLSKTFLFKAKNAPICHGSVGWHPGVMPKSWMPAYAGMTIREGDSSARRRDPGTNSSITGSPRRNDNQGHALEIFLIICRRERVHSMHAVSQMQGYFSEPPCPLAVMTFSRSIFSRALAHVVQTTQPSQNS